MLVNTGFNLHRRTGVCAEKLITMGMRPLDQGLTLAHFRAQLENLRDKSLTLELNLSTFGKHPRSIRVIWGTS